MTQSVLFDPVVPTDWQLRIEAACCGTGCSSRSSCARASAYAPHEGVQVTVARHDAARPWKPLPPVERCRHFVEGMR